MEIANSRLRSHRLDASAIFWKIQSFYNCGFNASYETVDLAVDIVPKNLIYEIFLLPCLLDISLNLAGFSIGNFNTEDNISESLEIFNFICILWNDDFQIKMYIKRDKMI